MPKSHAERKQEKIDVFEKTVSHIMEIRKAVKVNDLFDDFHGDVFTNVPYFVRSFVLLAEKDERVHIKSAQRAGTWAAPVDVEFPELTNRVTKKSEKKLVNTDHIQVNDHPQEEVRPEPEITKKPEVKESTPEPEKETVSVDMSTTHEESVPKPSATELFGDKEPDGADEWEEDRFFTDADGKEYEGKMSDIDPSESDNWYKINKRLLTSAGYTDVIELYKIDDDHTNEYAAITIEGKVFHFVEV